MGHRGLGTTQDPVTRYFTEVDNLVYHHCHLLSHAVPGTTLPHTSEASTSDGGPAPLSPPTQTLAPSPRPLSSAPLITTKRPASTGGRSTPSKKPKETPTGKFRIYGLYMSLVVNCLIKREFSNIAHA